MMMSDSEISFVRNRVSPYSEN